MKTLTLRAAAFASALALLGTAFVPYSAAQPGDEPFDAGAILPSPAPQTGELVVFNLERIVSTQTQLIRYEATEYQRKVAEQRARAFVAAQRRNRPKTAPTEPSKTASKKPETPEKPEKTDKLAKTTKPAKPSQSDKPAQPDKPTKSAKTKAAESTTTATAQPKELPRYIAVDTVKDKRASPTAKKVVMIWDTHAEALVGNNVYDVKNPPHVGETTNFETYSAQYIGAGL